MGTKFAMNRRNFIRSASVAILAPAIIDSASAAPADVSFQLSWIKSAQYGGYFSGIEHGIFKQNDISPTFNSGGPNIDPIANVASGQYDLGDRPVGSILIARDKGIPVKIIGTVFAKSPFCIMSLAAKPIRSIKDLEGKTIAVPTSTRPVVLYLLKSAGVDPASVKFLPGSPDPAALASGQIDALPGYSTNQGVMLQTRGVELFMLNVQDLGVPETTGTIYAREDYLAKNPDKVIRFLRAASQAWRFALDHPEDTAKLMVDKYGASGLDYTAQLAEVKASKPFIEAGPHGEAGILELDMSVYERIIDIYHQAGIIGSKMKLDDLCDPKFVDAALKSQ
ncbi:ABC transporter substrate-binding protein [Bradyrhizobium sp. dw_411]|uniref:ABC transporter substrate-binding protein n=1 Tax=Bradyrhizobium sp. dw_411 TaxID=2720082 RepID=UPI001BCF13DE|nr:ABC transporter substrate-binding protein [Bradyrhizobium sp. dw_411]